MIPRLGSKELGRGFLLGSWGQNEKRVEIVSNSKILCIFAAIY